MKSPSLYEISADAAALDALLEEQEGGTENDLEVVSKWFDEMTGELDAKLARCIAWAKEQEALAAVAKGEAQRLSALAKRRLMNVDRLKGTIEEVFIALHISRRDTPLGAVRLVRNGGKAPLLIADGVDLLELPDGCYRAVIEPVKDALRERLEAGEKIEGVTIGERGQRIEIG